ncbi:MAG TPA: peroxiredoxin [Xanthobacteraceae bacterium]|nr:peroxiredoxin [Xanthobacteraceae bacterium]
MTIKPGDKLPSATFRVMGADGPKEMTTADIFSGKKAVLIGMPGAFTPTCHRNHLPGYVEQAEKFRDKGVDTIAVTTTNDHFVMGAWSKASDGDGKVVFLADGNGEFAKAVGLAFDGSARGLGGVRSKRYSMYVEDGVVKVLNTEENAGQVDATSATKLLSAI